MAARAYNAVFTAETLEPRTSAKGKPYLRARGVLQNSTGPVTRTVLVRGPGYDDVRARMRVGEPLGLRGFYERVRDGSGRGGQFFSAFGLANRRPSASRPPETSAETSGAGHSSDVDSTQAVPGTSSDAAFEGPSVPAGPVTSPRRKRRTPRARSTTATEPSERTILPDMERKPMPTIAELEARALEKMAVRQPKLIEEDDETSTEDAPIRRIEGHLREPYWRRQRHGPGRSLVKTVYIGGSAVNGGPRRMHDRDEHDVEAEAMLL